MTKISKYAVFLGLIMLGCSGNSGGGTNTGGDRVSAIKFCNTMAEAGCDRLMACKALGTTTLDECYKTLKGQENCSELTGDCPSDKLHKCSYDYYNSVECSDIKGNTIPDPPVECQGICTP